MTTIVVQKYPTEVDISKFGDAIDALVTNAVISIDGINYKVKNVDSILGGKNPIEIRLVNVNNPGSGESTLKWESNGTITINDEIQESKPTIKLIGVDANSLVGQSRISDSIEYGIVGGKIRKRYTKSKSKKSKKSRRHRRKTIRRH
jgi:hypothetical protein